MQRSDLEYSHPTRSNPGVIHEAPQITAILPPIVNPNPTSTPIQIYHPVPPHPFRPTTEPIAANRNKNYQQQKKKRPLPQPRRGNASAADHEAPAPPRAPPGPQPGGSEGREATPARQTREPHLSSKRLGGARQQGGRPASRAAHSPGEGRAGRRSEAAPAPIWRCRRRRSPNLEAHAGSG